MEFLQAALFLDFFFRKIDKFWSTWTRIGEEKMAVFLFIFRLNDKFDENLSACLCLNA